MVFKVILPSVSKPTIDSFMYEDIGGFETEGSITQINENFNTLLQKMNEEHSSKKDVSPLAQETTIKTSLLCIQSY